MTNKDIKNAYIGTTEVKAMYLGSTKVWPKYTIQLQPHIGDFVYGDKTWSSNLINNKTCVGIITDVRDEEFDFISLSNLSNAYPISSTNILWYDVITTTNLEIAKLDFKGKYNTEQIISAGLSMAVNHCKDYSTEGFPGGSWYIPALGQFTKAYSHKALIDAALKVATGNTLNSETTYWTSTQWDASQAWTMNWQDSGEAYFDKLSNQQVRPFCTYRYGTIDTLDNIYILDTDDRLWSRSKWDTSNNSKAMGVAIITSNCAFCIAKEDGSPSQFTLNSDYIDLPGVVVTDNEDIARMDFKGSDNTKCTMLSDGLADAVFEVYGYNWPNKQIDGYLGSIGEWYEVYKNIDEVETCLSLIGGESLTDSIKNYWTSTCYDIEWSWVIVHYNGVPNNAVESAESKKNTYYVRSFCPIDLSNVTVVQ